MMINDKQMTAEEILQIAGVSTGKKETPEEWFNNHIYDSVQQTSNPDDPNNHKINDQKRPN